MLLCVDNPLISWIRQLAETKSVKRREVYEAAYAELTLIFYFPGKVEKGRTNKKCNTLGEGPRRFSLTLRAVTENRTTKKKDKKK